MRTFPFQPFKSIFPSLAPQLHYIKQEFWLEYGSLFRYPSKPSLLLHAYPHFLSFYG